MQDSEEAVTRLTDEEMADLEQSMKLVLAYVGKDGLIDRDMQQNMRRVISAESYRRGLRAGRVEAAELCDERYATKGKFLGQVMRARIKEADDNAQL